VRRKLHGLSVNLDLDPEFLTRLALQAVHRMLPNLQETTRHVDLSLLRFDAPNRHECLSVLDDGSPDRRG
jgi:hypothetical protein